jgi:DNA-binding Lrp family transcriptional regulator
MADDDFKYTGIHAFVFINEVHPAMDVSSGRLKEPGSDVTTIRDVVDALRAFGPPPDGPVIFAAELLGSAKGFAHLRAESLAELQDFIGGQLSRRGIASNYGTEADTAKIGQRKVGAKRDTPEVIGLIRLRAQKGRVQEVLEAVADEHGPLRDTFKGASVVFGDYDILLQLGGDTFEEVAAAAYGPLQEIEGIASSNTAFTDARRYEE